jgi:hypothetical protein
MIQRISRLYVGPQCNTTACLLTRRCGGWGVSAVCHTGARTCCSLATRCPHTPRMCTSLGSGGPARRCDTRLCHHHVERRRSSTAALSTALPRVALTLQEVAQKHAGLYTRDLAGSTCSLPKAARHCECPLLPHLVKHPSSRSRCVLHGADAEQWYWYWRRKYGDLGGPRFSYPKQALAEPRPAPHQASQQP